MAQLGAGMLRVLRDAGDDNDASVRNFAASLARGDYLLLLSPQMVIGESDWLDELINHALRQEVAVVGARILSPQGTLVGGGQILGLAGPVRTPFYGASATSLGSMQRRHNPQHCDPDSTTCWIHRKQVEQGKG